MIELLLGLSLKENYQKIHLSNFTAKIESEKVCQTEKYFFSLSSLHRLNNTKICLYPKKIFVNHSPCQIVKVLIQFINKMKIFFTNLTNQNILSIKLICIRLQ